MQVGLSAIKGRTKMELDPRTKLFAMIVVSMIMITGDISGIGFYIGIGIAIIPFVLLLISGNLSKAIIYGILITFSSIMEIMVMNISGIANIIFLFLSGMISRFLPGVFMGYYLVSSTTVGEFITAMKKMRISDKIVIPFAVMFRFIPTIVDENKSIGMAMKMRGIGIGGNRKNFIELVEYRLIPVIMATVRVGNELSAAALTKGLETNQKRTSICKIGFHFSDLIVFSCVIAGAVLFIFNQMNGI
ncbi:MAG: energy-coupling factor transporter transmembrane component T [Velocimicrobium sp.]